MLRKFELTFAIILTFLILTGCVFQNVALFKTASPIGIGNGYWGPLGRDGVWHEALSANLSGHFPPTNPGFAGQGLKNYHYYYDLLVALVSKAGIAQRTLIYLVFPIIFSVLLGAGTCLLSYKLFGSKRTSLLAVFFVYFGSSFGWVLDVARGREIGGESAFWANQSVSANLNPPFMISLIGVIFFVLLLEKYLLRPKFTLGIILTILGGVLIGFKVYAGVIVIASLVGLALKRAIVNKSYNLVAVTLGTMIISCAIYLGEASGASLLQVQPFWLIDTMIDAGDRVGIPQLTARRFSYIGSVRRAGLLLVEIISLLIFVLGNIGTRFFAFAAYKKGLLKNDIHLFVHLILITSFLPTLIFIQKGNAWNIIQFLYYFLFFLALYAAWGIHNICNRLPASLAKLFLSLVICITPISSIATFRSWLYPNPPAYISTSELSALTFLKNQPDGVVLKHPFEGSFRSKFRDPFPLAVYADSAYVSAYSWHEVYIEDVEQQIILGTDYAHRLELAQRFFQEKDTRWSNDFLKNAGVKYIYLQKIYSLPMAEDLYEMKKIFENDAANVYQVTD